MRVLEGTNHNDKCYNLLVPKKVHLRITSHRPPRSLRCRKGISATTAERPPFAQIDSDDWAEAAHPCQGRCPPAPAVYPEARDAGLHRPGLDNLRDQKLPCTGVGQR